MSTNTRCRRRERSGFALLAVIVVLVFAIIIGAAVVAANAATSAEQTRLERAEDFYADLTAAGSGVPLFVSDIGDPPGRLSDLSFAISTAGASLCGKSYNNGDVGAWTGSYVARVFPNSGTPIGIGTVSDTLLYEEVSNQPNVVFLVRSVPEEEAIRLDARVDTIAGTAGSSAGAVRWTTPDATGLVTVRWSASLSKKCTGGNQSPTAAFTFVCTGFSCVFTDGSTDADGTITSWSWAFGDATASTAQNPTHAFAVAGTYSVSLTVTDNALGQGTVSQNVSVSNIVLSVTGRKVGPNRFADLTWSGATTANVDVYRDGVLIVTTPNDGAYTDTVSNGTFAYKVCEQGTQICSNTVSVTP